MKKLFYVSFFLLLFTLLFCGNTFAAEPSIKSGVPILTTLPSESTVHTYQFTTDKEGELYLLLDNATAGFYVNIFNAAGNYIAGDAATYGDYALQVDTKIPKGTYYVKVGGSRWIESVTSASYRVKATYASSFTRNPATFEPNDTVETSMSLIAGKFYTSTMESSIDQDVYQFTSAKDGGISLSLDNTTAGFYVNIFNAAGNYIAGDAATYGDYALQVDTKIPKGTYYVKIGGSRWIESVTSAKYRLKATFLDKVPSVDPLYDTTTLVTGSAFSNTKVIAVAGTEKIGETIAKDGKYNIKIAKQKAGTKIGVYTIDSVGNQSSTRTVTVADATIKVVSTAYNKLKINWSQVTGVHGYEIFRSTSNTGTYNRVATVTSGSTLSYTNENLTTGKTYYYKVKPFRTVNGAKVYSHFSDSAYAKPTLTAVSAKAAPAGYSKNKVSWSPVSGANGYVVYRATSKTGMYSTIKTVSNSTVSYENTGLTTGKTYYYKVRAYRTVNGVKVYSPYSSTVNAVPALASPSKLTVVKASSTSIKASWSKVSEASGYELYRATSKTGTYTKVKTQTSGASNSYTNTGLGRGKIYYYKVRAYRIVSGKKIYSPYTAIVSARL